MDLRLVYVRWCAGSNPAEGQPVIVIACQHERTYTTVPPARRGGATGAGPGGHHRHSSAHAIFRADGGRAGGASEDDGNYEDYPAAGRVAIWPRGRRGA